MPGTRARAKVGQAKGAAGEGGGREKSVQFVRGGESDDGAAERRGGGHVSQVVAAAGGERVLALGAGRLSGPARHALPGEEGPQQRAVPALAGALQRQLLAAAGAAGRGHLFLRRQRALGPAEFWGEGPYPLLGAASAEELAELGSAGSSFFEEFALRAVVGLRPDGSPVSADMFGGTPRHQVGKLSLPPARPPRVRVGIISRRRKRFLLNEQELLEACLREG